jgi:hypothetical protein
VCFLSIRNPKWHPPQDKFLTYGLVKKWMGKQLVNFITCGCECTLFCIIQSRMQTHAVLVISLYELLGNPTT